MRMLANQEGDNYLVTGPAFVGGQLRSIGSGVLVPTSTWKAVYDPHAGGTGAYACLNTARPRCAVVSVAQLAQTVGIDPFPALPARIKAVAMTLPDLEASRYGSRRRRCPALPNESPGPIGDAMTLMPFADDAASLSVGKLTVENGTDRVAIYGSLDITRDRHGLAQARALLAIVQAAVGVLENDKDLAAVIAPPAKPKTVANPFA